MKNLYRILLVVLCLIYMHFSSETINQIIWNNLSTPFIDNSYEKLNHEEFIVDIKLDDVEEFTKVLIATANEFEVIVSTNLIFNNEDIMYLYAPNEYKNILNDVIPKIDDKNINYNETFIISHDYNNSALYKDNLILNSVYKIKSIDYLYVDELEFFWNIRVSSYSENNISSFKNTVNYVLKGYYLNESDHDISSGYDLNDYIIAMFKRNYLLFSLILITTIFIVFEEIKSRKKEISICKLLGYNNISISIKIAKGLIIDTIMFPLITLSIINIVFMKANTLIFELTILFQVILLLILLLFNIILLIYVYLFVINIKMEHKNFKNKIIKYNKGIFTTIKIIIFIFIIPIIILDNKNLFNIIHNQYLLKNNYVEIASISKFVGFEGLGDYTNQQNFINDLDNLYENKEIDNLYKINVSNIDVYGKQWIIYMDSKTAEYYNISCNDRCVVINSYINYHNIYLNKVSKNVEVINNNTNYYIHTPGSTFEYFIKNPIILVNDINQSIYTYFYVESEVNTIKGFETVLNMLNQNNIEGIRIESLKGELDILIDINNDALISSAYTLSMYIMIIILISKIFVEIEWFYNNKTISVNYILGKSYTRILKSVLIENILIYIIIFTVLLNLHGFTYYLLWVLIITFLFETIITYILIKSLIRKNIVRINR